MRISVGIDAAKEEHWATAVTAEGRVVLNRMVTNTGEDIRAFISELAALGDERIIGIDMLGGIATLITAMLVAAGEHVVHVPGLAVNRARQGTTGGQAKSDPKDARVIADQLRLRDDFRTIALGDDDSAELRLLVGRRDDLVVDQTRRFTRLRYLLTSIHPSLERVLDVTQPGPLTLLGHLVTAAEIRAAGRPGILAVLKNTKIRQPDRLAKLAAEAAAKHPEITLPGEAATAELVREFAAEAMACRARILRLEKRLETLVSRHPDGALIRSLPGMGAVLTAKLLAQAGDFRRFRSAAALAAAAGLAPVLRQSGKSRHLRRPSYANNNLKNTLFRAAFCSLGQTESRAFYDRKRAEGKRHSQALIALARRRVDVLWAIVHSRTPYNPQHRLTA